MSTQQDIYAAGSESRPPMLNKENYAPWSSRLLRYAKSRQNGKLINNSLLYGPYIEADDQAIQTILLGLPEDIYAAIDSCETAQEIWLRVQQMIKGSDIGIQEKKAKLFNEWEREDCSNLKFLNNLQPEWSRHVTIVHQTKDLHTTDYTQLYDFLKYNQKEVDELKAERLAKTQDPLALMANSNNHYAFPAPHQDQSSFNQNYSENAGTPVGSNDVIGNRFIQNAVQNLKVQNVGNQNGLISVQGNGNQNQIGNGNLVVARAEGNAAEQNGNQIRCYKCRGVEDYDLMAAAADLDEIEEVNANCILIANLQQASTSGTQTDSAPVYDTDGSAEAHENCDNNEIFNMFTQEEQYTELLEPIFESHQVPQHDNDVISEDTSVEQGGETVEQHPVNFKETRALYESLYQNLAIEVEKVNSVNRKLKETNADMTTELARFKNQERCFEISQEKYDKLERCYQQSVYQEQCLSKKINALHLSSGYQNPFYLKQAQKKQQSLYDGKVLLEKHDPPVVHDSKETLQLAQESRDKMKQLNKEIKPANYTKINHLSGVFVPQKALSREELYFSYNSKTANVSKLFSIPNEDLSDDNTPSVARKFLDEVKSTIVTLQRVIKQRMTIETHNWASSAHQELHKIVRDANFSIFNQVDARLQNFEIQSLKEAAKFFGGFKSLANEADASLAKHKALELEIERLLKAVVSQDIMIIVQNESVVDTSDLQTKLEPYKDMQQKIKRLQARLGDLKGKSKDTSCVSDTRNPLSQKLENENVEFEFQVLNYARGNAHLKATYKNLFDSISVSRAQTRTIISSLQNELQCNIYKNAKLRRQLFKKFSDQKDNIPDTIENTKFTKQPIVENLFKIGETNALSKPVTSNSFSTPQASKGVNTDKVIAPGMFRINLDKTSREAKKVPNTVSASARTKPITVSQPRVITRKDVNSDLNG
uniref:Uncharacterized protein n=1 Tax=Tanacetum cinerariifolium TaxID=118510 RepID=A0A6L2LVQ1_TANCI|nr:hypothetical protein [Tanacetum cinerariifolium]